MKANELYSLCEYLGIQNLRQYEDNIKGCCPIHREEKPSWGISVNKEQHPWGCFSCRATGTLLSLVRKLTGLSKQESLGLIERYGEYIEFPSEIITEKKVLDNKPIPWYYLTCYPELDSFRGNSKKVIEEFLLRKTSDGIAVPYVWRGNLLGVVKVTSDKKTEPLHGFNFKRHLIVPKSRKSNSSLIIVEGVSDALRVYSYGFTNVVALSGVSFTKKQEEYVRKLSGNHIVCAMDNDYAGKRATFDIADRLSDKCVMEINYDGVYKEDPDKLSFFEFLKCYKSRKIV